MHNYSCCRIPVILTLSVIFLLFTILPAHSQPVGGLGKITDSGFSPIAFPGFMAGPEVRGMISFDMDGDGKPDAVVVNAMPVNTLTFFRNMSTPALPDMEDVGGLSAGHAPAAIAYGDLDGDGKPDFAVVNNGDNNISVYRNTSTPGHISFDTAVNFGNVTVPGEILIDDFDHDGKLDMAVAVEQLDTTSGISIFRNTSTPGHLSFQQTLKLPDVYFPVALASHDLTGDSLPELVYCPYPGDRVRFLVNTSTPGSISFDSIPSAIVGSYPDGTAIGDLDGDGKPDVAVSNSEDSSVYIFRNTSTGNHLSYQQVLIHRVGNATHPDPGHIIIADVNLDSKPDLIVQCYNDRFIAALQNTTTAPGSLSFDAAQYINPLPDTSIVPDPLGEGGAFGFSVDDFDGDGRPDLLLTDYRPQYNVYYNTLNIRHNRLGEPHVIPSGASPVSDTIAFYITIDSSVQTYQGSPYLQRHFDIEPATNPATSTATITLFYNQQDFDNYNALAVHGDSLPAGPADTINKAHIRLIQYHGASSSHTPGTYTGSSQVIDPDDNNIVWNDSAARWEITFDVTGFSGFFLTSSGTTLPLTLLSFTGQRQENNVLLDWTTTHEIDVSRFEVQRSTVTDGFTTIATMPDIGDHHYTYTDAGVQDIPYFYRLRVVDLDGNYTYSRIIAIEGAADALGMTLFPNPATDHVTIQHPAGDASARIRLLDMTGRVVRTVTPDAHSLQTSIILNGLAAGIYQVQWSDSSHIIASSLLVK
jgi:hypothetical protein